MGDCHIYWLHPCFTKLHLKPAAALLVIGQNASHSAQPNLGANLGVIHTHFIVHLSLHHLNPLYLFQYPTLFIYLKYSFKEQCYLPPACCLYSLQSYATFVQQSCLSYLVQFSPPYCLVMYFTYQKISPHFRQLELYSLRLVSLWQHHCSDVISIYA